jgi:hypothetical protein
MLSRSLTQWQWASGFLFFSSLCDIEKLVNFPTKLAKLVQFTLEKQLFPNFSQFLLSTLNFFLLFGILQK